MAESDRDEARHLARGGVLALLADLALSDAAVDVDERQPDGSWKTVRRFSNVTLSKRDSVGWRIQAVRAFPLQAPET